MELIRRLACAMPIDVAIAGRKRDAIFSVLDAVLRNMAPNDVIRSSLGAIKLDPAHEPERLLSYLFYNVLRYYRRSDLGRYIVAMARPGAIFIDVGANLGMYGLIARSCGYSTVEVEPEPRHNAFLKRNEAIFGKVMAVAFADKAGQLPLYYEPRNSGATSLFNSPHSVKSAGMIQVTTFSKAAEAGQFGDAAAISIVKIDVEGFEAEAVSGMAGFLAAGWRPHIWCEVRGDRSGRNGGSFRKVREMLRQFGYKAGKMKGGKYVVEPDEILAARGVFDMLFTPDPTIFLE